MRSRVRVPPLRQGFCMTLQKYHSSVRSSISSHLRSYVPTIRSLLPNDVSLASIITTALIDDSLNGKMNRSLLCFLAYDGYTAKKNPLILDIASALEITHTAYLIQDDVMDNDSTRRGKDALFVQLKKQYGSHYGSDEQLYKYLAVCIGDAGFHLANYYLSNTPASIRKSINEVFFRTDCGQYEDLLYSRSNSIPHEAVIESVFVQKTGKYSIGLPIQCGMLLAGAPEEDIQTMERIADILGLIYQITDDELNLLGDPKKTGKPTGSDIVEGKKTIHMLRLLNVMQKQDAEKVRTIFQKNNKNQNDCYIIIEAMHTHKIFSLLQKENEQRYKTAISLLQTVHMNPEYKKLVQEFTQSLLSRAA